MFVIVNICKRFHTGFVGIRSLYHHTKSHMLSSKCLLVIAIEPEAKYTLHLATMSLFYILKTNKQKQIKAAYFSKMYSHSFRDISSLCESSFLKMTTQNVRVL